MSHIEINIDIHNDHGHNRNRDPYSQIARDLRSMANFFEHHNHHHDHHRHGHHHNDGFAIFDHLPQLPQLPYMQQPGNPFGGHFDIPPLPMVPRAGDVPGIVPPQRPENPQDPLAKYHLDSIPLPPCPPGFDSTKWNDPTHNTLKYDMGRDIQKFLSTGVKSEQEVEQFLRDHQSMIEKHGFKFLGAKNDKIQISENGQPPYYVDAVFSVGGPESRAQWLIP